MKPFLPYYPRAYLQKYISGVVKWRICMKIKKNLRMQLILASEYFRVLPIVIVEKDYYITMILRELSSVWVLLYLRVEHRYQNVIKQSSVFRRY